MYVLFFISVILTSNNCDSQKLSCESLTVNVCDLYDALFNLNNLKNSVTIFNMCASNHGCLPINLNHMKFNKSLKESQFDPSLKTVVIIHGFSEEYTWAFQMAQNWSIFEPVNAIVVEWKNVYFKLLCYRKSALMTEIVALKVNNFIKQLVNLYGEKLNKSFHFVGHSLGAHIAGQAARLLIKDGVNVQRVTGLDPAHPCFANETASLRLRISDAEFVDVIHTNGNPHSPNIGNHNLMGHVDFYPNGGNRQPKCQNKNDFQDFEVRSSTPCENSSLLNINNCFFKYIGDAFKAVAKLSVIIYKSIKDIIYDLVSCTVSSLINPMTEINTKGILKNSLYQNGYCDHGEAISYFKDSLDPKNKRIWANPIEWRDVFEVTPAIRCKNRNCNNKTCIEMGINARKYESNLSNKYEKISFYVDTMNDIDCNRTI